MEICNLADIPIGSAKGYVIGSRSILVMRTATREIFAYLNRCPHLGVPLNWEENRFMDSDGSFICCSTHGALFEPATGLCILGPCRGESLWQLDCSIQNELIHIDESGLPQTDSSLTPGT